MTSILDRYERLLAEVDGWFKDCMSRHPGLIVCHHGCSACCRGLFDITILDALCLKRGFDRLSADMQEAVQMKAVARLVELSERWPEFQRPWTLNHIPEETWDEMMPEDDETPCPLLSNYGACLVYDQRPMTCRLNGIPLIESTGEVLFDEWCTLNFTGVDPMELEDLRYSFNDLFRQELLLFRELTQRLFGEAFSELDTIIPAAIFFDITTVKLLRPPERP